MQYYFLGFIFLSKQIYLNIDVAETLVSDPANNLESMDGTNGTYEALIQLDFDNCHVSYFDSEKLVVILNGFHEKRKKLQKLNRKKLCN